MERESKKNPKRNTGTQKYNNKNKKCTRDSRAHLIRQK